MNLQLLSATGHSSAASDGAATIISAAGQEVSADELFASRPRMHDASRVGRVVDDLAKAFAHGAADDYKATPAAVRMLIDYMKETTRSVVDAACLLAKHRGDKQLQPQDVDLILKKKLGVELANAFINTTSEPAEGAEEDQEDQEQAEAASAASATAADSPAEDGEVAPSQVEATDNGAAAHAFANNSTANTTAVDVSDVTSSDHTAGANAAAAALSLAAPAAVESVAGVKRKLGEDAAAGAAVPPLPSPRQVKMLRREDSTTAAAAAALDGAGAGDADADGYESESYF